MSTFPPVEWQSTVQIINDDQFELQNAINNAASNNLNTRIELSTDIHLSSPLTVPDNAKIYLTSSSPGVFTIDAGSQGFRVMDVLTSPNIAQSTIVYFGNINVKNGNGTPYGGAVYSSGEGYAVIVLESGAHFENNTAIRSGGAISLTKGAVGVFGGSLTGNNANENGGAIYIKEGHHQPIYGAFSMDIDSGIIATNHANRDGGGVYVESTDSVKIANGSFNTNSAIGAGGGLYVRSLDMHGGSVLNNNANVGAGIYLDGIGTISGTALVGGNDADAGGGVFMSENPNTKLDIIGNAQIVNNRAGAPGGGGIYLTEQHLSQLTVGVDVVFDGNLAPQGFPVRSPIHDAVYNSHIFGTHWSANFTQGYNNYDIRYSPVVPPEPIPSCSVDGEQMVEVCLPVTITPFANVGQITSRCCGEAIISRGENTCLGTPRVTCNFTIRQRMCVRVPVEFGTTVQTGEAHVLCTEENCNNCEPHPEP